MKNRGNKNEKVVKNGFSLLFGVLTLLVLLISTQFVSGEQLPLPMESTTKVGSPSWTLNTSDLVGDQGDWSRPAFADFDADGDYDMVVGYSDGIVRYWRNDGNATDPSWTLENSDLIGDIGSYADPSVYDFDSDGDFDLIIGTYAGEIRYYENTGIITNPSFTYRRTWAGFGNGIYISPEVVDYNADGDPDIIYGRNNQYIYKLKNDVSETGIFFDDFGIGDVGAYSSPFFVDIDNDNDFDVYVGNSDGKVYFYENTGTLENAVWAEPEYLFDVGDNATLVFADFDNDNDFDMLAGKGDGTFDYYRNDGMISDPYWTHVANWFTVDVGDMAAPTASDLDNDGDYDLIIGNSAGATIYYRNEGTPENPNFILDETGLVGDIGSNAKPHFADMDSDGDFDLIIGRSDNDILYYINNGTASSYDFISMGIIIDAYDFASPAAVDIDNDGNFDIASGSEGGWTDFFENTGNAVNFIFSSKRDYWHDNFIRLGSHDYVDFDSDGDYDLVKGAEDGYIRYYRNDGNASHPLWTYVRQWFGGWGSWTAPALADMDNDGDYDITFGRSNDAYLYYFENDASESSFKWTQLSSDMIGDIGSTADPAFGDLDNDGDLDMLVGRDNGYIYYYMNNGTAENPNFVQVSTNLVGDYGDWASPSLGDLDNDGDLDLVLGLNNYATVLYFRNDGNLTDHNFTYNTSNLLGGYCYNGDGNGYCTPELVDIDNDGDLDLVSSNIYYGPYYWRNDGTPSIPVWSPIGTLVGDPGNFMAPNFIDLDSDGDQDMVLGSQHGDIRYYKNIGTNTSHSFVYIYAGNGGYQWLPNFGSNTYIKPAFADLNNDSKPDLVIGLYNGTLYHYRNDGIYATAAERGDNPTWIYRSGNWLGDYCWPGQNYYGRHCTPSLGDMDNDGDLDMVVGSYQYGVYYWRNDGTPSSPVWTAAGSILNWNDGNHHDPNLGDLDNDGDLDMLVGRSDGTTKLFKNVGTPESPSWVYVYAGDSGTSYIPDVGGWSRVDLVDIDGDGDLDISVEDNSNDFKFLENRGLYSTNKEKVRNPTWISEGTLLTIQNSRPYGVPSFGDIDGDGDLDLAVGNEDEVGYYSNDGSYGNISYTYVGTWIGMGNAETGPAFVDIDADGDLDLIVGRDNGYVYYYRNNGTYVLGIAVIIKDSGGNPNANASVTFSDASGAVCTETTDAQGKAVCDINFTGGWGRISVTNATPGTINLGITSPNSYGMTTMQLQNPSNSFTIDLERFVFYTYSADNQVTDMYVEISDAGKRVFSRQTRNGFIDGFFPKKYIANMQEPYTQNRIMYDIKFKGDPVYVSDLEVNDVYVPNEINISSALDKNKLYKFLVTHTMSTDSNYKGYIIYPVLKIQKNFNIMDTLPDNFTYTGNAVIEYLGEYRCTAPISGTSFNIDYTTPGCEFLENPVPETGDWLKVGFTVRSPSLDLFITEGWTTKNYIIPPAELNLVA